MLRQSKDRYNIIASIRNSDPFNASSMTGISIGHTYIVLSYNEPILIKKNGTVTYMNRKYYSTTTSRHQNICTDAYGELCNKGEVYGINDL